MSLFQITVALLLAGIAIILLCTRTTKKLDANGEEYKRLYFVWRERAEAREKYIQELAHERNTYQWAAAQWEAENKARHLDDARATKRACEDFLLTRDMLASMRMTVKANVKQTKGAGKWWKVA